MNRTETAYSLLLEDRKRKGEILWFKYEPLRLILAPGKKLQYTPDFLVINAAYEIEFHEIKGSFLLDSTGIVKLKAASEFFPFFRFFLAIKGRKNEWTITRIGDEDDGKHDDGNDPGNKTTPDDSGGK